MDSDNQGHRQRLRERFLESVLDGFHDHEVLEFLLSFAIPRKDLKRIAKGLLEKYKSLSAVLDASSERLEKEDGMGPYSAVFLSLMPRLVERYQQDRWKDRPVLSSTRDAVAYLFSLLGTERNEVFYVLALDSKNSVLAGEDVQRGSVNRTAVFPRQVVEVVIRHRATAVILAHNHPGGDPTPSASDRQLTRKLKRILNDLDIHVHDHIIIGGPKYFSFAEQGELE